MLASQYQQAVSRTTPHLTGVVANHCTPVPDFRSSSGLFKSLKGEHKLKGSGKQLFDASVYKDDTSTSTFHDMVSTMSRLTKDVRPTAFHHMLATIAKENRLLRLYTQNIDGIDTALEPLRTSIPLRKDDDGKWPRTVQLHGGLDKMVCSKCHELSDFDADLFSGPTPPLCPRCEEINDIRTNHEGKRSHGIGRLRPRMVLYNEHNPDDMAIGAVTRDDLRKRPDAVIVVGTGLDVPGVRRIAKEMCGVVRDRRGGVAVWINKEFPQASKNLEDCFDIIVRGTCDEVANRAAMRRWDEPEEESTYSEVSEEEARRASANLVEVQVPKCELIHAKLEPLASQRHINNSFSPPPEFSTPRKSLQSPIDWSPMSSRNNSIRQSIELLANNMTVQQTGLLTPTKSDKSSPPGDEASKMDKPKLIFKAHKTSLQSKKLNPTTKTSKGGTKSAKPKTKPISSSKSKALGKLPPGSKPNSLTNSFKTSKNLAMDDGPVSKNMLPSPSKLRQVLNAASEPMHPVPPQDSRNNTSPSKVSPSKKPFFPGLTLSNDDNIEKRKLFA